MSVFSSAMLCQVTETLLVFAFLLQGKEHGAEWNRNCLSEELPKQMGRAKLDCVAGCTLVASGWQRCAPRAPPCEQPTASHAAYSQDDEQQLMHFSRGLPRLLSRLCLPLSLSCLPACDFVCRMMHLVISHTEYVVQACRHACSVIITQLC